MEEKSDKILNFYNLFWIFITGSFLGVFIETIYCFITRGYFESRSGLIYGPFNLVYGFGILILTLVAYTFRKNNITIFIVGTILGAMFEYFCSWFQELLFGTISWRYDEGLFNFNGRINLTYAVFWGLLTLVWFKYIVNFVVKIINKVPKNILKNATCIFGMFMIINVLMSYLAVNRMSQRRIEEYPKNKLETFLDKKYNDEYLKKIYPNMWYVN